MVNCRSILFLLILLSSVKFVVGQKSYAITTDVLTIDAQNVSFQKVKPGDTLVLNAGARDHLLIKNFQGTSGNPIIMINSGGAVIIDTDNYYGISIQNCRYLRFTGTGDPNQTYGFQVKRVANGAGMGIGYLSSDIEIDHVAIENTLIGGIYAKTDPDCTLASVRGTFTQYNTIIHDNYIANTGNEGLYIGSTQYTGQSVQCGTQTLLLMPSLLDGVKIYNNTVKYSGWDGIQVSSASSNCQIYDNTILFDSQAGVANQMSGILIGGGTKCDCYNNFICNGKGDGIDCLGLGGTRIFNNIILNPGLSFVPSDKTQMKHGIFVGDNSVQKDSSFYIKFNDILNPKSDGIRFSSINSRNNLIASNAIINPGNFDYYQNGNTRFKGTDSYVMLPSTQAQVTLQNNYLARNASSAGFASSPLLSPDDFKLLPTSPLIDHADVDKNINFDFSGLLRPVGIKSDIGAFEYNVLLPVVTTPELQDDGIRLLQNPVREFLIFKIPQIADNTIYLDIYDLTGKKISQLKTDYYSTENATINVSTLSLNPGIYIYTIRAGEFANSGKFIKNK